MFDIYIIKLLVTMINMVIKDWVNTDKIID